MQYYVYILQSLFDGTFYKGYTTDYLKRLEQHNNGESRYTRGKMPWILVYVETCPTKTAALVREKKLKRSNSKYLYWLINNSDYNLLKRAEPVIPPEAGRVRVPSRPQKLP